MKINSTEKQYQLIAVRLETHQRIKDKSLACGYKNYIDFLEDVMKRPASELKKLLNKN